MLRKMCAIILMTGISGLAAITAGASEDTDQIQDQILYLHEEYADQKIMDKENFATYVMYDIFSMVLNINYEEKDIMDETAFHPAFFDALEEIEVSPDLLLENSFDENDQICFSSDLVYEGGEPTADKEREYQNTVEFYYWLEENGYESVALVDLNGIAGVVFDKDIVTSISFFDVEGNQYVISMVSNKDEELASVFADCMMTIMEDVQEEDGAGENDYFESFDMIFGE